MNRNWLAYQRQIALLLAATPRTSATWSDQQYIQLHALRPLDNDPYYAALCAPTAVRGAWLCPAFAVVDGRAIQMKPAPRSCNVLPAAREIVLRYHCHQDLHPRGTALRRSRFRGDPVMRVALDSIHPRSLSVALAIGALTVLGAVAHADELDPITVSAPS